MKLLPTIPAARQLKLIHGVFAFLLLPVCAVSANENRQGQYYGAIPSERPQWFKESFLEFEEDVAEAAAGGRRVMLYFHQEGCPYCARLVDENFTDPEIREYTNRHFDGISLNMWGDREVVSIGGRQFTEKTFAQALKVQYTPTLLFLDESGKTILRLNGYYPPADFRAALEYAAQKMEQEVSFSEFRLSRLATADGELIDEEFYLDSTDLEKLRREIDKPLVVYFEAPACGECEILHQRILADEPTRRLVVQAANVQLDIGSEEPLVTPSGRQTTARQWALDLGIDYTPSLVFFDRSGQEVMRISAFIKTFHFQSAYAYVLEGAYLEEPEFQRYLSTRGERIREAGFDTDIWGYESFHD